MKDLQTWSSWMWLSHNAPNGAGFAPDPAFGRVLVLGWEVAMSYPPVCTDDVVELELKLDARLGDLLGANYCADTEIGDDFVHVRIYEGSLESGVSIVRRLDYDLAVLESGVEEAAERIHLDWLFS